MKQVYNKSIKKNLLIITLLISFFIFFWCVCSTNIYDVECQTLDNEVIISWKKFLLNSNDIHVDVYHNDSLLESLTLDKYSREYVFTNGKHGEKYKFDVYCSPENIETKECLFIDIDSMPNLPIIKIETENGKEPTFKKSYPKNDGGISIKKNYYVDATISIDDHQTQYSDKIKIKVRGNSSAYKEKKGYKILFDNKIDLFHRNNDIYLDNEYVLLGSGECLNTEITLFLSKYCGVDWQPKFEYVNLFLNNDYRGCYLLIENVKKSEGRINVSDNGCVIENDPFYWNSNKEYFKSTYQNDAAAWTFIYPQKHDVNYTKKIEKYVDNFEELLYANNEDCMQYIDPESFSSWLFVNDILSVADAGGTNMYLSKYDYIDINPTASKLRMATNWDYDTLYVEEGWSQIHNRNYLYFQKLFEYDSFKRIYVNKWDLIKDNLYNDCAAYLDSLYSSKGKEIDESRQLDSVCFGVTNISLEDEIAFIKNYLKNKIEWIDKEIEIYR